MIEGIPLPSRGDGIESGFWRALDAGILAHQRCTVCRHWHFPPRARCHCGGSLDYEPVSGRATLWSYTVAHPPLLPAFAQLAPYPVIVAELDEQPGLRMVGTVARAVDDPINAVSPADLRIGMPLRAAIVALSPDIRWPRWLIET